jgi:hypothetical protein
MPDDKIKCTCGKEWSKQQVESDKTVHTIDSFRFGFLRTFKRNTTGFSALMKVNACPECRDEVVTA